MKLGKRTTTNIQSVTEFVINIAMVKFFQARCITASPMIGSLLLRYCFSYVKICIFWSAGCRISWLMDSRQTNEIVNILMIKMCIRKYLCIVYICTLFNMLAYCRKISKRFQFSRYDTVLKMLNLHCCASRRPHKIKSMSNVFVRVSVYATLFSLNPINFVYLFCFYYH